MAKLSHSFFRGILVLAFAGIVTGCKVDPADLADSRVETGHGYRYGGSDRPLLPTGRWWECFGDSGLNRLMDKLASDNPSLAAALARYDNARAELGLTKADQSPSISGDLSSKRRRDSASAVFVPPERLYSEHRAALNLSYEIDLWGRVRQSVKAARAELEAAGADWAAARLSLQAELARTYFQLRSTEAEIEVVEDSLEVRRENQQLIEARVEGGETTDLDLARADTELEATRAELLQLQRERAQFFNAVAFLVGEVPANFNLPSGGLRSPPSIPSGIPSELLSRRPDIFAADRRMDAAVAQIGAVKASYLPRINLVGTAGLSSLEFTDFFDPKSFFGEVGPDVTVPIYNGGQINSAVGQSFAISDEAVARYRETVLTAFREVEDALAANRYLDREIVAHSRAAAAASRASTLSRTRYDGGLVSYLEVVDAERTSLSEERELVQAKSARLLSTVQLIQALGGGWEKPAPEAAAKLTEVHAFEPTHRERARERE